jgi:UDP-N-acetylglucosamine 4,6-dehydratase
MNKNFFKNKNLLITGGTGSLGQALVSYILKNKFAIKKIIIFSRDEWKQHEMSKIFSEEKFPCIRYFLGDVRDKDRLVLALKDVDYVIHAAALKHVPIAEYNPFEFIKTNVIGTQNLIETSLNSPVKKLIVLSTDKACSPLNLYGATKLCSEKIALSANFIKGKQKISFSVVRYGNVLGSRGSVLLNFIEQKKDNIFNITDLNMTRFLMMLEDSVEFVLNSLEKSVGGEIFIPKLPSFYIKDLAKALSDQAKFNIIGVRPGEKIHEDMISESEGRNIVEFPYYYKILHENFIKKKHLSNVNFFYNSKNNKKFLSVKDLKLILKKYSNQT